MAELIRGEVADYALALKDNQPNLHAEYKGESMKKLLFLASLVVLCLPLAASAQEVAPKVEIFGGYSLLRVDPGSIPGGSDVGKIDTHGFNVSMAGNVAKHVGIVSEFSRFTKSGSASNIFGDPRLSGVDVKVRVFPFMFGPRVTLHRGKVEPFVHALFGVARPGAEASALGVSVEDAASSFASALGGGLDIKAHNNLAIRLGQVDYLRARAGGEGSNNFRYSVGVVIRLGNR
jgi:opacity protein-like surface antigen